MLRFFKKLIADWKNSIKFILLLYKYVYLHTYDLFNYIFGKNTIYLIGVDEAKSYTHHSRFLLRERLFKIFYSPRFFTLDVVETRLLLNQFYNVFVAIQTSKIKINPRFLFRLNNYNYKPYIYFYNNVNLDFFDKFLKLHLYSGYKSVWKALRYWVLSLFIAFSVVFGLSYVRVLPVNTILFQWFALAMFGYWLLSGFVFFIKKYQFTRFTSAVQRFWRRSYILFWLIESCLLVVFIYLTFNSSQESIYMVDQIQVFKTHLLSWRLFFPKLFLLSVLVILGYLLMLNVKWNIFRKNIPILMLVTIILTYMIWTEFYQIYHVSNYYANLFWAYDVDDKMWVLESDVRRTRIVNHYVMILFILKFWHIVFIYSFWIFFILRANELGRIRYPLYSANFQNFIILYIMGWLFMYPWFKFTFHKFLESPYYWFFSNTHKLGLRVFFYDIKLILYGFVDYFTFSTNRVSTRFNYYDFFYWSLTTEQTGYLNYRKHTIRNFILSNNLS